VKAPETLAPAKPPPPPAIAATKRPSSAARTTLDELKEKIGIIEEQVKRKPAAASSAPEERGMSPVIEEMEGDIRFIHGLSERIKSLEDSLDRKNSTIVELQERLDERSHELDEMRVRFADLERQMHMELAIIKREIAEK
jgi:uncharacterized coiled-coil protein SlyX